MKIIISPAKTLDFKTPATSDMFSYPVFVKDASIVNKQLRTLSVKEISSLMNISLQMAGLNYKRNQDWSEHPERQKIKQAVLAYAGDVYQGLNAVSFTDDQLHFAQGKIRIISGLYGLLKPLDLIQPYRLEMGTSLAIENKKNLYSFWSEKVTSYLKEEIQQEDNCLVNLASTEYFKVIDPKLLNARIITPVFKDLKAGQYKMISFYAKRARGLMCRFIVENRIEHPEEMKAFDLEGYLYNPTLTKKDEWVFTREH